LRVETLDIVLLHRVDDRVPVEKSIEALAALVSDGVVGGIGLSEASTESIARAHSAHPLAIVESEFSLWSRDVETAGVIALCSKLGIPFVASSPLGKGFLTGALTWPPAHTGKDSRLKLPRFSADVYQHNVELLDALRTVARDRGATMAQVALAWVLRTLPNSIVIPSTSSAERVQENAAAADVQLTEDDVARLGHAFSVDRVQGERYADMGFVNR
jgi:aryl-alcohol dehydrogenase-like predicted oxidoreductase